MLLFQHATDAPYEKGCPHIFIKGLPFERVHTSSYNIYATHALSLCIAFWRSGDETPRSHPRSLFVPNQLGKSESILSVYVGEGARYEILHLNIIVVDL